MNVESAPWTDDKILREYKFCNSYMVNDRVSQYLLKNVIYNGKKYFSSDMLFRILLFKLFNKESTWELLIGNYMAYQLVTDINYSDVVDWRGDEFTVAGPVFCVVLKSALLIGFVFFLLKKYFIVYN